MISLYELESVASNDIQSSRSALSDKAKATPTSTPRQQTFMYPDSKTSNSKQSKFYRIKSSKKKTHIENTTKVHLSTHCTTKVPIFLSSLHLNLRSKDEQYKRRKFFI